MRRLDFGEFAEGGIDSCLDGTLAKDLRAERVDGADGGFLEMFEGLFEMPALFGGRLQTRTVETLAKPQLQLSGGFVREGDRDNAVDAGDSGAKDVQDAPDEFGGLAGAGGGFDDEGLGERVADAVARASVIETGSRRGVHGRLRNWFNGSSSLADLRRTRISS